MSLVEIFAFVNKICYRFFYQDGRGDAGNDRASRLLPHKS